MPPNTMDDFFDVKSAFKKYDRNHAKWMNVGVDENGQDKRGPTDEVDEKKYARRAMRALVALRDAAEEALRSMEDAGWGRVVPNTKILPEETEASLEPKTKKPKKK